MKITQKILKRWMPARLFRWTAFAAALGSMLALAAVMSGWCDSKSAELPLSANEAWQYYVGNVDMSAFFRAL
jgi:hypothetical protein